MSFNTFFHGPIRPNMDGVPYLPGEFPPFRVKSPGEFGWPSRIRREIPRRGCRGPVSPGGFSSVISRGRRFPANSPGYIAGSGSQEIPRRVSRVMQSGDPCRPAKFPGEFVGGDVLASTSREIYREMPGGPFPGKSPLAVQISWMWVSRRLGP